MIVCFCVWAPRELAMGKTGESPRPVRPGRSRGGVVICRSRSQVSRCISPFRGPYSPLRCCSPFRSSCRTRQIATANTRGQPHPERTPSSPLCRHPLHPHHNGQARPFSAFFLAWPGCTASGSSIFNVAQARPRPNRLGPDEVRRSLPMLNLPPTDCHLVLPPYCISNPHLQDLL